MRLTAGFWVQAYLARLAQAGIPAFVCAHGDETAGAVIVKLNTLDGQASAWHRVTAFDGSGARRWDVLAEGLDGDVEAALTRQRSFDPDLWIIEIEDRAGRTLLGEDGLAE